MKWLFSSILNFLVILVKPLFFFHRHLIYEKFNSGYILFAGVGSLMSYSESYAQQTKSKCFNR